MTLDEFFESKLDRSWVEEDGMDRLYVRKGPRAIRHEGKLLYFTNVFDIGAIQAEDEGRGAFRRLVDKLEKEWDGPIFVESVLVEEFMPILLHMGFVPVNPTEDFGGLPRNFAKHLDKGKKHAS